MSAFSFSFSGDDIEEDTSAAQTSIDIPISKHAAETGTLRRASNSNSAFPVAGQPLLEPQKHDLHQMLKNLPERISYSTLTVKLDDGSEMYLPRRELWDVRVQLMAEDDEEGLGNLGKDDVRTGVYEGGFKSWESSVDVVKELGKRRDVAFEGRFLELGCGTALPSLAVFQWLLQQSSVPASGHLNLGLADYNPTVLQLVTLPNLLLSWAQVTNPGTWEAEGELEIDQQVIARFLESLKAQSVSVSFYSGTWSPEFVVLVSQASQSSSGKLMVIGAETIYSPAALALFGETLISLLSRQGTEGIALIAAKKVYFGVGGSLEDFCDLVRAKGSAVEQIREESDGVRRAVVEVKLQP